MTAVEFVRILVEEIGISALFVGDDFRFGFDRSGDFQYLEDIGKSHHFDVINMYTISHDNERVSSTRIRQALEQGNFALAQKMLGRPYTITGKVVYGRQLGRTLGSPTANLELHRLRAPLRGVYTVTVSGPGLDKVAGVANVGTRPTVNDSIRANLEVHLLDWDENIYGCTIEVTFCTKLRDEQKFASLEELREHIEKDIERARAFFGL